MFLRGDEVARADDGRAKSVVVMPAASLNSHSQCIHGGVSVESIVVTRAVSVGVVLRSSPQQAERFDRRLACAPRMPPLVAIPRPHARCPVAIVSCQMYCFACPTPHTGYGRAMQCVWRRMSVAISTWLPIGGALNLAGRHCADVLLVAFGCSCCTHWSNLAVGLVRWSLILSRWSS